MALSRDDSVMLNIVLFTAFGVALVLSLMPRWNPEWKKIWSDLYLALLWLWLTQDAIADGDRSRIVFTLGVWPVIAWPYMKALWAYVRGRHEA
jgi:hypothetical protein